MRERRTTNRLSGEMVIVAKMQRRTQEMRDDMVFGGMQFGTAMSWGSLIKSFFIRRRRGTGFTEE